ncbi:MAG: hypothetical protein ACLPHP_08090 [Candidatus Sulfotelmatobacter sp.]
MGGIGSGQRWNSKATTSAYSQMDVRCWQRNRLLVMGQSFVFGAWDVEVIACGKRDEPSMVRLYQRGEGRQQLEPYRIWIEWTPCNYGGKRAWFVCPRGCGHRVAIVYYGSSPACRQCYRLAYESQQASAKYRSLHGAQAIRMQLGGSASIVDPFPAKPKGMHWHRYQRLYTKAMASEEAFLGSLASWLNGLSGRSGC